MTGQIGRFGASLTRYPPSGSRQLFRPLAPCLDGTISHDAGAKANSWSSRAAGRLAAGTASSELRNFRYSRADDDVRLEREPGSHAICARTSSDVGEPRRAGLAASEHCYLFIQQVFAPHGET